MCFGRAVVFLPRISTKAVCSTSTEFSRETKTRELLAIHAGHPAKLCREVSLKLILYVVSLSWMHSLNLLSGKH